MYKKLKRICTICARAGSKGVKNKNIRQIAGKPLIGHTVSQAIESGLFDLIAASSDSPDILMVAKEYGVHIVIDRPSELATDNAGKLPAIRHCVEAAEKDQGISFDTIVDLAVTSPLRNFEDINGAISLLESTDKLNVVTGAQSRCSPYFSLVEIDKEGKVSLSKTIDPPVLCRQDSPQCFDLNGSVYVWRREGLFGSSSIINSGTGLFVMPEERSLDIDTELDFKIVELLLEEYGRQ